MANDSYRFLRLEKLNPSLAEIQISRPERLNALGMSIAQELLASVSKLQKASPKHALIISAKTVESKSGPIDIAGGDLNELRSLHTLTEVQSYAETMHAVLEALNALPCLVVTIADGAMVGGGVELFIAGDLRLAHPRASFHLKQLRVGLPLGYGTTERFQSICGLSMLQYMLFGDRVLTSLEAKACGLVHEICPDDMDMTGFLCDWQQRILALSSEAIAAQKKMFALTRTPADKKEELRYFLQAWGTPHHSAFMNKFRSPSKS